MSRLFLVINKRLLHKSIQMTTRLLDNSQKYIIRDTGPCMQHKHTYIKCLWFSVCAATFAAIVEVLKPLETSERQLLLFVTIVTCFKYMVVTLFLLH